MITVAKLETTLWSYLKCNDIHNTTCVWTGERTTYC